MSMQFVSMTNGPAIYVSKYMTKHEPNHEDGYRDSQQPCDSIFHFRLPPVFNSFFDLLFTKPRPKSTPQSEWKNRGLGWVKSGLDSYVDLDLFRVAFDEM